MIAPSARLPTCPLACPRACLPPARLPCIVCGARSRAPLARPSPPTTPLSPPPQGQALVDATLGALRHVTRGLALCGSEPRYAFLRYNGSLVAWRLSAPLRREGSRAALLPVQDAVCQVGRRAAGARVSCRAGGGVLSCWRRAAAGAGGHRGPGRVARAPAGGAGSGPAGGWQARGGGQERRGGRRAGLPAARGHQGAAVAGLLLLLLPGAGQLCRCVPRGKVGAARLAASAVRSTDPHRLRRLCRAAWRRCRLTWPRCSPPAARWRPAARRRLRPPPARPPPRPRAPPAA
jgi:hypothetical protein